MGEVCPGVAGVETAATSTQGTFVGVAISPDDFGTWSAVIVHEPLADTAEITGSTFVLDGPGAQPRRLDPRCTTDRLLPQGDVQRDRPRDALRERNPTGEFGDFEVTLTHYGRRVPGFGCVTFLATVEGLITFTPSP
jgi:hypothetical protein